jgi:hypothetical protein
LSFDLRLVDRNRPWVWMRVAALEIGGHTAEVTMDGDNEAPFLNVTWDTSTVVFSTQTTPSLYQLTVGEWHPVEIDVGGSALTASMDGVSLQNASSRTTFGIGALPSPLDIGLSFGAVNGSAGPHGAIDVRVDTVVLTATE